MFSFIQQLIFLSIGLFTLVFSLSSCQKSVEGCTQPVARNFNPEADTDCCCEFYNLQLAIQHLANDSISFFTLREPFELPNGTIINPLNFNLLVHKIELRNTQNKWFSINDTLSFSSSAGNLFFANDFNLISPNSFVYNIGKFTQIDSFNRLRFVVGLSADATQILPESISDVNNPLSIFATPLLYDSTRQSFNSSLFSFALTNPIDTVSYRFLNQIVVDLPCNVRSLDNNDTRIKLNIYYGNLFNTINFHTDPADTIKSKFERNLSQSFEVI
jgi:hypothetical protein